MSNIAIRVENLSKQYHIGSLNGDRRFGYQSLRDTISDAFTSPIRRARALLGGQAYGASEMNETIFALKDVSFEVKRGEVVGIIGRNGAGKSTLLKILSRITEPTEGQVTIYGRVGSLLEVGTGFHPELTGRENIYLNGAILGMRRSKIERQFDEIVDFSGVERFIDTPVKYYSSGMYLRLAFAVAAHLEPEILLVDEVLAVGDAEFQKKCLGKMGEVAGEGRTVLFVSHNMGAVRQLCQRVLLLEKGALAQAGTPAEMINHYLSENTMQGGMIEWRDGEAPGSEEVQLRAIKLFDRAGELRSSFRTDEEVVVVLEYRAKQTVQGMRVTLALQTTTGEIAFVSTSHSVSPAIHEPGLYQAECLIPANLLNRRRYLVAVAAGSPGVQNYWRDVSELSLDVDGIANHGSTHPGSWDGVVCPKLSWRVKLKKYV